ncbi:MAG: DJ-1/PfpI family protein [Candidatus Omnitrophica bacterium]|nr:DJ-1/PfpI family protein [Candidatus Omnitrophota bacterium]
MARRGDREVKKTVLVALADGFEEIEAVTPIDVLRRAGLDVIVAGVGKKEISGAHGITIRADVMLEDYRDLPDAVVLPGGMPGADNLKKSKALGALLSKMDQNKKLIGAICAAPARVLAGAGILDGKKATCYPGYENDLGAKTTFVTDRVVKDGRVITSRGPGTALEFALELVCELTDSRTAGRLAQALIARS